MAKSDAGWLQVVAIVDPKVDLEEIAQFVMATHRSKMDRSDRKNRDLECVQTAAAPV